MPHDHGASRRATDRNDIAGSAASTAARKPTSGSADERDPRPGIDGREPSTDDAARLRRHRRELHLGTVARACRSGTGSAAVGRHSGLGHRCGSGFGAARGKEDVVAIGIAGAHSRSRCRRPPACRRRAAPTPSRTCSPGLRASGWRCGSAAAVLWSATVGVGQDDRARPHLRDDRRGDGAAVSAARGIAGRDVPLDGQQTVGGERVERLPRCRRRRENGRARAAAGRPRSPPAAPARTGCAASSARAQLVGGLGPADLLHEIAPVEPAHVAMRPAVVGELEQRIGDQLLRAFGMASSSICRR